MTELEKEAVVSRSGSSPPLYAQIKESIIERIEAGEFCEGDKLPSEAELIECYGVSRITAVRVMKELEADGLVLRVHGKGTYVQGTPSEFNSSEIVGVVVQTTGHLYGPLTGEIIKQLYDHQCYCILLDINQARRDRREFNKLQSLLDRRPGCMIFDGYFSCPLDMIEGYDGNLVFIRVFEHDEKLPADYVLSDYYKGGRLAAERFFARGVKKFFFYLPEFAENTRTRSDLIRGAADFLKKKGLEKAMQVFKKPGYESLFEEIRKSDKPVGVLCDGDYLAKPVYLFASEEGLEIPGDIAVMGYYDTPWSVVFEPALTSVSIREQEIARIAAERILNAGIEKKTIMVEPVIVERSSA